MGSFPNFNGEHIAVVHDSARKVDELSENSGGEILFESSQIGGESMVQGVRDDRPQDVEVNSDHYRGGKRVEIEERDHFRNFVSWRIFPEYPFGPTSRCWSG